MKGIYCGFGALAAIIVAIFLDNIRLDKEKEGKRKFSIKLAEETVRHFLRSTEQKLLVPLTLYSGVEQAFILATFTSVSICSDYIIVIYTWRLRSITNTIGFTPFHWGNIPEYVRTQFKRQKPTCVMAWDAVSTNGSKPPSLKKQ